MTNRPHVHVRLGAFEFSLCHDLKPLDRTVRQCGIGRVVSISRGPSTALLAFKSAARMAAFCACPRDRRLIAPVKPS
ncbi:hypothetical protein ALSL_2037 [Aerosticca soli]|uniref:Uncharacterized protein n=1 Tax=Aerosticca soli TaxID=2010829 RepID=A0A2Z6E7C0_9GAMM|nr:hypothetical protein ALSL_2037 [Aerosticca soli]